jgi:hypothetical protein
MISFTHQFLYPWERTLGTHCIEEWLGHRACLYSLSGMWPRRYAEADLQTALQLALASWNLFTSSKLNNYSCEVWQSQSYFTAGGLPPISSSWRQAPWDSRHSNFIFQLNTCHYSPCVTSSLTRGWVCRLRLLLVLASAGILRWKSRGTHDHILLSQIRDSPNLDCQVPVFISSRNRVARLYSQALGSFFVASYD